MNAQNIRLNLVASNIANANSVAGSEEKAFKALNPVFSQTLNGVNNSQYSGVAVTDIQKSQRENAAMYQPDHPLADEKGYIYQSNVNPIEEMANMISASRSYQTNVEVLNTSKSLMMRTIRLGE